MAAAAAAAAAAAGRWIQLIQSVAIDRIRDALCGQAMEGAHSDYVSGVALCGLECWVSASLDGTLCAWTLDGNGV